MAELPTGTVTFLLTDIEESTTLWEQSPELMRAALTSHDALFEAAVTGHDGVHIRPRGEGDSRFAVFSGAAAATAAALTIQRAFSRERWPTPRPIRVRIGIHTGEAELKDDDYYGAAVNRCARIRGLGQGGQTLLSEATETLVRESLPDGAMLRDLGIHHLKGLTQPERIYQLSAPDLPESFPPLHGPDTRPNNLPRIRGALIGREREITELRDLLLRADVALVTMTGPGGIGKTRLAIQAAAEMLDQFADGAYFVGLAAIRNPELVAPTMGQVLGIAMDGGRPPLETLKEHFHDRAMLIVLDNLEQVIEVGPQLTELLSVSDRLKFLVTSRVMLRLSNEHEYDVPSLRLPPHVPVASTSDIAAEVGHYEAIRLFVDRAQAVRPDFTLTNANARDVVEVCHRLDGLPLAIELAAARTRLLPPSAMLGRLARQMSSPSLTLLTGGPRDLPTRQQTLRNTIAWSYDLLEPWEQALFRRLALFVGGCTIDAATAAWAVTPAPGAPAFHDVLDGLDSLLTKSLLRHIESRDNEPRYSMLETIREYGLESLAMTGELSTFRRWHAEYFLALAETAEPRMRGSEQGEWLDRLESEKDNLRAALEWSLSSEGDSQLALRLAGALSWYWYNRSHLNEARNWVVQALEQKDEASLARIKALAGAGRFAHIQHDADQARSFLNEALELARGLENPWWASWTLHLLGRVSYFEGEAEAARAHGHQSLALAREIGDEWLEGWALHLLGLAAHIEADYPEARRLYEESLVIRRRIDFREGAGTVLTLIGLIDFTEGDYLSCRERYREALELYRPLDAGWLMGNLVAQFLALAVAARQPERAARLWGALSALSEAVSIRPIPLVEAVLEPALGWLHRELSDVRFEVEQQAGRRMSLDDVSAEALAIDVFAAPTVPPGGPRPSLLVAEQRDGLSPRELEVLSLIASGSTSQEIADTLVISVNTVERHITHVYRKIGVRGRAEATAYALQHSML